MGQRLNIKTKDSPSTPIFKGFRSSVLGTGAETNIYVHIIISQVHPLFSLDHLYIEGREPLILHFVDGLLDLCFH